MEATIRRWDVASGEPVQIYTGNDWNGYVIGYLWGLAMSHDGRHFLTGTGLTDISAIVWDATVPTDDQEGLYFNGHTGGGGLAFSPDDKYILTGNDDYAARQWDVATREIVQTFSGHTDWVEGAAFSPDGRYLLTGSSDHTARLWAVATGETVQIFSGHLDWVYDVAFSPDSNYVLTGSADNTARLWNVATGETVQIFSGHTNLITSVAFSPGGRRVLTSSADATARLWQVQAQP